MDKVLEAVPGFTIGADPEFFLYDLDKGHMVSATDYLPGTKEEPHALEKGAVQVDGLAAEINIDPASSYKEFSSNITTVLQQVKRMVPDNIAFMYDASTEFKKTVWDKVPEEAKVLGCSPDFNAWTGEMNPPPNVSESSRVRCAGGHIHIGWTDDALLSDQMHVLNCRDLVRQLDYYLGAWSLNCDYDKTRRSQYGKAGSCRIKPYGVEYRVLSNFWLTSGSYRRSVWNRTQQAITDMRQRFLPDMGTPEFDFNNLLIESINEGKRSPVLESHFSNPIKFL